MKYDVFGMGAALVDFIVEISDEELKELNLSKGMSKYLSRDEFQQIYDRIRGYNMKMDPGGSCANTAWGVSLLGGKAVIAGKIGMDTFGDFFKIKTGSYVKSDLVRSNNDKTGNAITFITPDKERTFVVYSGASIDLKRRDINLDDVKESRILHTEGYQIENSVFKDTMIYAMDFAKKNNVLVSMDVSDTGVISRNKEEMLRVIRNYVNVIFANEEEAKSLTGKEKNDALNELGNWCEIAVIKLGKEGSLVRYRGKNYKIEGFKVNVTDSTGAGDMYAAGFLYGLSRGYEIEICGYLGSYFAAKVVEKLGARLEFIDSEDVYKVLNREIINSEKIIKSY